MGENAGEAGEYIGETAPAYAIAALGIIINSGAGGGGRPIRIAESVGMDAPMRGDAVLSVSLTLVQSSFVDWVMEAR